MKKLLVVLMVVLLCLPPCGVAEGALPTVSFDVSTQTQNGGVPFFLTVKLSAPASNELSVNVSASGETLTFAVPAGQTVALFEVTPQAVSKRTQIVYQLAPGEGYQVGGIAAQTVTLATIPRFIFEAKEFFGYKDQTMMVGASLANRAAMLSAETLELRDETGRVLATRGIEKGGAGVRFAVNVTEDMMGGHRLSIWWKGIQVSDDVYSAIGDKRQPLFTGIDTKEKVVSITMDFAYGDFQTEELMDLLDKHGVKITCFLTGDWATNYPDKARDIAARGHEIGCHSLSHPHISRETAHEQIRQVRLANDAIEKVIGARPVLFRPPFGEYTQELKAVASAEGMKMIMWSLDTIDWDGDLEQSWILAHAKNHVQPGDIILFHNDGRFTYDVLDQFIPFLQQNGYEIVPISSLMARGTFRTRQK